jgi:hypothetical protein
MRPSIRVELLDGTNTWITFVPIDQLDHTGAIRAAGEAFAWFVSNLGRDRNALDIHLKAALDRP